MLSAGWLMRSQLAPIRALTVPSKAPYRSLNTEDTTLLQIRTKRWQTSIDSCPPPPERINTDAYELLLILGP